MNTTITQEDIDFYQENGFFIKDDFLSPDEVANWIKVLEVGIKGRGSQMLPNAESLEPDVSNEDCNEDCNNFYSNIFVQRVNLWQDSDGVKELILDPAIGEMCTQLADIEGFRVWHDQALYKAPYANPTSWHPDNPYWSYYSKDAMSIWIALDDATPENGCMHFLPGTQKKNDDFTAIPICEDMGRVFETYPEFKEIQSVSGAMKAGSCSFHNGLTIHGAGANMTANLRRAMTCGFMPIGSTFNGQQNILTKEQVAKLTIGDVMDDDEQNPIVYQRSAATV